MSLAIALLVWLLKLFGVVTTLATVWEIGKRLWRFARERIANRHFCRVFPLAKGDEVIVVCPVQPDITEQPLPTTHHDLLAATAVVSAMAQHGVKANLQLAAQLTEQDLRKNLFLICGPVGNAITGRFLERVHLPYVFKNVEGRGYLIVDDAGRDMHPQSDAARDFALIAKTSNPWGPPGTHIFLAAGIRGLGTTGAAVFFVNHLKLIVRQLLTEGMRETTGFAAVVECVGDSLGFPLSTKLLKLSQT